ncbi:MAG TPA: hypothetical protein VFZ24_09810, partial [Longimicrobiales bacterium]
SIFVVLGASGVLLLLAMRGELPEARRVVARVIVPWSVAAITAGLVSRVLVSPETMTFVKLTWEGDDAFGPLPVWHWQTLQWLWHRLVRIIGLTTGLGYTAAPLYVALAIGGFWEIGRKRRRHVLVLLAPIVVTFGVAMAQVYPFSGRLVIFLLPSLLLAIAAAVAQIGRWFWARGRSAAAIASTVLAATPPVVRIVTQPPVYRLQEARPLLEWVSESRQEDDAVFVWYRLSPNVLWYGPMIGMPREHVVWGGCWLDNPRRFLEDLEPMRGRNRVWLLAAAAGSRETRLLFAYADSIGRQLDARSFGATLPGYFPLEGRLYDFSDQQRLARYSAKNFPVSIGAAPAQAILACTSGPMAVHPELEYW